MEIQITTEKENKLLHRKELKIRVSGFGATPNRNEVLQLVAAKAGANDSRVVLDKLEQRFGQKEADGYVKVYDTEENKKRYEPEYKLVRGKKKEEGEQK